MVPKPTTGQAPWLLQWTTILCWLLPEKVKFQRLCSSASKDSGTGRKLENKLAPVFPEENLGLRGVTGTRVGRLRSGVGDRSQLSQLHTACPTPTEPRPSQELHQHSPAKTLMVVCGLGRAGHLSVLGVDDKQ